MEVNGNGRAKTAEMIIGNLDNYSTNQLLSFKGQVSKIYNLIPMASRLISPQTDSCSEVW